MDTEVRLTRVLGPCCHPRARSPPPGFPELGLPASWRPGGCIPPCQVAGPERQGEDPVFCAAWPSPAAPRAQQRHTHIPPHPSPVAGAQREQGLWLEEETAPFRISLHGPSVAQSHPEPHGPTDPLQCCQIAPPAWSGRATTAEGCFMCVCACARTRVCTRHAQQTARVTRCYQEPRCGGAGWILFPTPTPPRASRATPLAQTKQQFIMNLSR